MNRGIKRAGIAILLGTGLAISACSSTGGPTPAHQIASCKGGYPDGGSIMDMSPYSPHADPFHPPCESKG